MSEQRIQRRLAAILAADVVGYSRLMERDEASTLASLKARRKDVFEPMVARHQGRIFKEIGDALLVEFGSAVNAVECAADLQQAMAATNAALPEDQRLVVRIGVNLGDVMIEGDDLYGDGVNIAARLEALAEPGGVAISDSVHQHVRGRIGVNFVDRGRHEVKNIERPVHVWAWSPGKSEPSSAAGPAAVAAAAEQAPAVPDRPSIAVLPFDNMSGDPEQGYFADGITEDIITDLSKVSGLFVIARNSSFAYKGKAPDVRQVSRELGVRYVLEGSVRKAASRIRINAQMIDGTTGGHVWAERYDREIADIFEVQDEVTRTIIDALKVRLTPVEEARRDNRGKINPEAYDLLVRARQMALQLRPEAAILARGMLERAIEIEPQLAAAYARLAVLTFAEYINRWNGATLDNFTRAIEIAKRALEVDETEQQAHVAMAIMLTWQRRLDEAERHAERAIALDPNGSDSYTSLGNVREYQGRAADAVALYTRAYRLDPQWDMALHFMGRALLALGRIDEAETAFKKRLLLSPRSDMTRFYLACVYAGRGRYEEARRLWEELIAINPAFSIEHYRRTLPYADPTTFDRVIEPLKDAGIAA
jgi:adenylate cyclase